MDPLPVSVESSQRTFVFTNFSVEEVNYWLDKRSILHMSLGSKRNQMQDEEKWPLFVLHIRLGLIWKKLKMHVIKLE